MTAIVIIPARYDSTRFPGKPLAPLNGKPLIQHVYENSKKSKLAKDVIVATDSGKIFKAVNEFGGKAVMTAKEHSSGTDRIAEAVALLDYDIIVNVQGDEPLIRHEMIDDVISLLDDKRASIGTLMKKIENPEEIFDPNVVKVVCDKEGFAMYFSRAPIPFDRDEWKVKSVELKVTNEELKSRFEFQTFNKETVNRGIGKSGNRKGKKSFHPFTHSPIHLFYKHLGLYSYRRAALLNFAKMEPVELEQIEKLEQLRALVNGLKIKVKETFFETIGVDTPQDLERVKEWLSLSS